MDAFRVLAAAILQHAGAINYRFDFLKKREPFFRLCGGCNIQAHPSGDFQPQVGSASNPNYLMSFPREASRNRRPNQPCCSGYQNFHVASGVAASCASDKAGRPRTFRSDIPKRNSARTFETAGNVFAPDGLSEVTGG